MHAEFVAGDTGSKLVATCKDKGTGDLIDLTGQTVRLKYRIAGGALQTKTMTVSSPSTAGKAEYLFLANELAAGEMVGEVEIEDGTGKIITQLDPFRLDIRAKT